MKNSTLFIWQTIAALFLFSAAAQCFSQTKADAEAMEKWWGKFKEHQNDFADFSKSVRSDDQLQLHSLFAMATIEGEHAVMLRDLCLIASLISDKPTKLKVQAEVVVFRLSTMLTTTTNNLQTINGWLPNIQNTATVVQANRLKDDVKGFQAKVREILDAIFKQAGIENKSPSK